MLIVKLTEGRFQISHELLLIYIANRNTYMFKKNSNFTLFCSLLLFNDKNHFDTLAQLFIIKTTKVFEKQRTSSVTIRGHPFSTYAVTGRGGDKILLISLCTPT